MRTADRVTTWFAWLIISFFYSYQYIIRVLPNIAMNEIMQRFHINVDIFGQFVGIYYITYAGFHLPIGTWLDRKGPKLVIPFFIIISVIGMIPLLYSNSWIAACIGRALMGIGSSAAILGLFKVVHLGFSEDKFSRMLGIGVTIGLLGAIYGSQPISSMLLKYGYEVVVTKLIFIGLFLAIISYFVMPKAKGVRNDNVNLKRDFILLWKKKRIFLIGIFGGLMVSPLEGFADAWGTTFLQVSLGLTKNLSSFLPSLIFLGMCFGTTIIPYIADKTRRYYEMIIFAAFAMSIMFFIILFVKIEINLLKILLFLIGIFSAYQVLAVYKATTYVHENLIGLSTASVNMLIMLFGYFFHTIIGKIIYSMWDGKIINGTALYSAESFTYGIIIIPLALLLGGIGFIWIYKKPY